MKTFKDFMSESTGKLASIEKALAKEKDKIKKIVGNIPDVDDMSWTDIIGDAGSVKAAVDMFDYSEFLADSGDEGLADQLSDFINYIDRNAKDVQYAFDNW